MNQNQLKTSLSEELIKFAVPKHLKEELQALASQRNITLSALLRLVVTDYIRSRK
jgi:antitoxin component of RelBE/YafQ-DinJ toxin-antitoxin module